MLSIRSLARSLPRATSNFSTQGARNVLRLPKASPVVRVSLQRSIFPRTVASFSTTASRLEAESDVNTELAAKLGQELTLEKESRDADTLPEHVKEFIDNTPFELHDTPGSEEVAMTRTYGDEKIKVTFNISDLNNVDEDPDQLQDTSMEDEFDESQDVPTDTQSGGANTKGAINQGRTSGGNFKVAPEDSISPADNDTMEEIGSGDNEPSFPAHLFITVEKANKGALQIEAVAQDGMIVIDNIYFFKNAALADPATTEHEKEASRVYTGPPFGNLDEDLQVLFENYLSERGINTTMALFVPEYIDYKEQKEYLNWLSSVKDFVE